MATRKIHHVEVKRVLDYICFSPKDKKGEDMSRGLRFHIKMWNAIVGEIIREIKEV